MDLNIENQHYMTQQKSYDIISKWNKYFKNVNLQVTFIRYSTTDCLSTKQTMTDICSLRDNINFRGADVVNISEGSMFPRRISYEIDLLLSL